MPEPCKCTYTVRLLASDVDRQVGLIPVVSTSARLHSIWVWYCFYLFFCLQLGILLLRVIAEACAYHTKCCQDEFSLCYATDQASRASNFHESFMVVMLAIIEIIIETIIEIMLASSPKLLRWTSSEQICQTLAGVRTNETAANVALQHGESKLNERHNRLKSRICQRSLAGFIPFLRG